jgi:hypothetical protein
MHVYTQRALPEILHHETYYYFSTGFGRDLYICTDKILMDRRHPNTMAKLNYIFCGFRALLHDNNDENVMDQTI